MSKKKPAASNGGITATLGELVVAEQALQRIGQLIWPVRTAYQIQKLSVLVEAELRSWHQMREKFIRELGAETSEGQISVTPANQQEFVSRLNELAAQAVTIPWQSIPETALDEADDPQTRKPAKFAPADLRALGPLLNGAGK